MFMMPGVDFSFLNMKSVRKIWYFHTKAIHKTSTSLLQLEGKTKLWLEQDKSIGTMFVTNAAGNMRKMEFYVSVINCESIDIY